MGVWLNIALEALVQSKLECLKNLSHSSPLAYDGSMSFKSLSESSKKCWSLLSEAWKIIFQLLRIVSHSFLLFKSHEDLYKKLGTRLNFFVSLSTVLWSVVRYILRPQKVDLAFPYFLILIFRTLGLGLEVIGHAVTPVTSDGVVTILITRLKRRK